MLIKWAFTFEDTRGVVTANTDNQLRTKTWAELSKWHGISLTKDWATLTATALISNAPGHDKTWRIDAVPWSQNNTEAFAGLHNEGRRILLVFDEASAIADKVWEVAGARPGHRDHLGRVRQHHPQHRPLPRVLPPVQGQLGHRADRQPHR